MVDQDIIDCAWASANCDILSVDAFKARADKGMYDRILYHFGNSEFHAHMPDLLSEYPGVVVLHDYFISGMLNWRQGTRNNSTFITALVESHGYQALRHFMSCGVVSAITTCSRRSPAAAWESCSEPGRFLSTGSWP